MPIINANIQKILRDSGLDRQQNSNNSETSKIEGKTEKTELETRLDAAGLSLDEVLGDLSNMVRNGGSEAIKLRAIENALKAHKVTQETQSSLPPINIIIVDPNGTSDENNYLGTGVNPIFIPRKMKGRAVEDAEEETVQ